MKIIPHTKIYRDAYRCRKCKYVVYDPSQYEPCQNCGSAGLETRISKRWEEIVVVIGIVGTFRKTRPIVQHSYRSNVT